VVLLNCLTKCQKETLGFELTNDGWLSFPEFTFVIGRQSIFTYCSS
jgi:hypothetical protein